MFYLIEISTGDSKIAGKAIYEYAAEKDAMAAFHQKLGSAMKSELYKTDLVIVMDSYGTVIKRERYADIQPQTNAETAEPS